MKYRRTFLWLPRRIWSQRRGRHVWRWLRTIWIMEPVERRTKGNGWCPECRKLGIMCGDCVYDWAIK